MRVDDQEIMRPPDDNKYKLLQLNFCWSSSSFRVSLVLVILLSLSVMSVVFYRLLPAVNGSSSSWSPTVLPLNSSSISNIDSSASSFSSDVILTAKETISLQNGTLIIDHQLGSKNQTPMTTTSYIISSSDSIVANQTVDPLGQEQSLSKSDYNESEDVAVASKTDDQLVVVNVTKRSYSDLERLEASLVIARSAIREAALVRNLTSTHQDPDYVPGGPMYWNANAFHRSYLKMEKLFKIYVYEEGEMPLFHNGPSKGIYSSEGSLIHDLEFKNIYRTRDPNKALVYFLPFSVTKLVHYFLKPGSHSINDDIGRPVVDYINVISTKYLFWNRSLGADHFMLSCHDWGPHTSGFVPNLFHKSIRVLCNANKSEGFNPSKDVTLPEINLLTGKLTQLLGGLSPSGRPILAFFAGGEHGYIRSLLFKHWKNKDRDVQVHEYLPAGVSYKSMMGQSRFCLCPSGYEVASPRIVEAIYAGCVPVIIKDGYVPPFSDVLNWKTFSVKVEVEDIPKLKNILMGISQTQYLRMQRRVKQVQRHFVVNETPKRFDIFHMIVHSIWLRRLNVQIKDFDDQSR
ncbi:hypothetical protein ACOSQ4_002957 [Xanthoceras sorbifolium]